MQTFPWLQIEPWVTMILSNKFVLGYCYSIQKCGLFPNVLESLKKYQNIFCILELPKLFLISKYRSLSQFHQQSISPSVQEVATII